MKQEVTISFFILLLCSFFVSAQSSSSIDTTVTVNGCDLSDGSTLLSGSCSHDGRFYCDETGELQDTLLDANACSFGGDSFTSGSPQCCPSGYLCTQDSIVLTEYYCDLRDPSDLCSDKTDIDSCQQASCFWISDGTNDFCVDKPTDYSCGVYQTEEACTQDIFNLGQNGLGTEACGDFIDYVSGDSDEGLYVIPTSTCYCSWATDSGGNDYCGLSYTASPHIYSHTLEKGVCSINYESGLCIEGAQEVNWTSVFSEVPFGSFVNPDFFKTKISCTDGTIERLCGVETITLPGFSLFSFFLSVLLIGLYYARKK